MGKAKELSICKTQMVIDHHAIDHKSGNGHKKCINASVYYPHAQQEKLWGRP